MGERRAGDEPPICSVRPSAMVFAPCHLVRVLIEVATADPMVLADLRAPQPGEKQLGLVRARAVSGLELDRMVDPPHVVGRMQTIPAAPPRRHERLPRKRHAGGSAGPHRFPWRR